MDLLLAFPSFSVMNKNTFQFLNRWIGRGDQLLKVAASRGAFRLFAEWPLCKDDFSVTAIFDYIFGAHNDNGEVRKLDIRGPTVSEKLLVNIVQVSISRRPPSAWRHSNSRPTLVPLVAYIQ